MKIDAAVSPVVEKDGGAGRGGRDGAQTEKAGNAFGEAVRQAGETRTARNRQASGSGVAETAKAADEAPSGNEGEEADETSEVVGSDDLRGLLLLMAAGKTVAPAGADDATDDRSEPAAPAVEIEETDGADASPADRRSQVRILRTETHFEPRIEGPLSEDVDASFEAGSRGQEAVAAASGASPDPAERIAQDLARATALAAAARRDPAASEPARVAEAATQMPAAAVADASPQRDAAPMPLRFDEAVARLGQPGARGTNGGGSAGQDGHEGERRDANRSDAAGTGNRSQARAEVAASATPDTSSGEDGAAAPLAGLAAQVASRIADALGPAPAARTGGDSPFAPANGEASLRLRAGGAALKTLTIQLQPEHLGTLEVSMRLREGKLAIELVASKPEAAAALTQDRETLRKVLEGAGFSMDDAAVTIAVRDAATAGRVADTAPGSQSGGGEGRSSSSGDLSRQGNGNGAAGRERDRPEPSARGSDPAPRVAAIPSQPRNAGGQTYL